jgi:AhpD family alkylhydroperoxidase
VIAGRVASSVVQRQVKYVTPVPARAAGGLVAEVYTQVADEMRLVIPPALLHSPAPRVLAAYWMLMREPLVAKGVADRAAKETVAAAVSVANICPYCVDMHSVGMYELATERDAEAVAADRVSDVDDPRIRSLAAWGRNAHLADSDAVRNPPFPAEQRAELVGVVVAFHYLNRMVNVFLSNFLLPPRLSPDARRRLKRGVGHMLSTSLREARRPGRSLHLLPDAPAPKSAGWAAGNACLAAAMGRAYAEFEAAGARSVPPNVVELVRGRLGAWRGEETGLSREWCERLIGDLDTGDRPAGRLALLTALASYQVDDEVVREFQRSRPGDVALVETAAWASFAAARQVGSWYLPAAARGTPPRLSIVDGRVRTGEGAPRQRSS